MGVFLLDHARTVFALRLCKAFRLGLDRHVTEAALLVEDVSVNPIRFVDEKNEGKTPEGGCKFMACMG